MSAKHTPGPDAHLIAAAPELLASCQEMLACIKGKKGDGKIMERARAAIAKATGAQ